MWIALLPLWAHAGEATLDVGLSHRQVRDDVLVPLRFSGGGLELGGGWRHADGPHHARAHLGLPIDLLVNGFGHLGAAIGLDADGAWDHTLTDLAGGELALGAAATIDIDQYFHAQWDDSHTYWHTLYGLGPRAAWYRPLGSDRLELWTALPALGLAARPPERWTTKVDDIVDIGALIATAHRGMAPTSLHEGVDWRGGVDWVHPMPRGAIAVQLDARFATLSRPERITMLSTTVSFERRLGGGSR